MVEKKNTRVQADMSPHEQDFNKRYLENIGAVRSHLQDEITAKGQTVAPKTGGKKIIPQPSANAVGYAPAASPAPADPSGKQDPMLNF